MSEIRMIFCFWLALCLSGCGILSKPENVPVAKLATQYAVLRFIEASAPDHQQERRERIRLIAADVQSLVKSDEQATVPALDSLVRQKVPWDKLSPSDTLLANSLIEIVEQELLARVGNSTIPREQLLEVATVMGWIVDATKLGEAPQ